MKKGMLLTCCMMVGALWATPNHKDFNVQLVGVATAGVNEGIGYVQPLSPKTKLTVTPGNLAVFFLQYDFPTECRSRLFLTANVKVDNPYENPFVSSGSAAYSGKGGVKNVLFLMPEQYGEPSLLTSIRIEGEILPSAGAERNQPFFICDLPVEILFSKEASPAPETIVSLPTAPTPVIDASLGMSSMEKVEPVAVKTSTPAGFTDNLTEALAKAKAEGKYVYICFSGSDWCYWCKKLEEEVLSKPAFVDAVKGDYELVYIDSPQDGSVLSDHAKANNEKLTNQYRITGFPTVVILDGNGRIVDESGYRKGGVEASVKYLESLRSKQTTK